MDNIINALAGGIFIGVAASLLLLFLGRITGISGIVFNLVKPITGQRFLNTERLWRFAFIIGLPIGALLASYLLDMPIPNPPEGSVGLIIISGFLVGFGTRMGNGCTSGHGVCGISLFSTRSIIATITFIVAGIITVAISNWVGG